MSDVNSWNVTDASNNAAPPDGFPENMNYSEVNNAARAVMGAVKRFHDDVGGSLAAGGVADAYTLTLNQSYAAYFEGLRFRCSIPADNTGASTINVNAIGATAIVKRDGSAMAAGELQSGGLYEFIYDGTQFQVAGIPAGDAALSSLSLTTPLPIASGGTASATASAARTALGLAIGTDVQAFDAHLEDLAALAAVSGADQFMVSSGAGAWSYETAAQVRTTLGLVIGTDVQAFDSDLASIAALATTSFGRGLLTEASASSTRTTLGLGSLATINSPLPVANGGTGATSASGARTNLGISTATTSAEGISELATQAETYPMALANRVVTPDGLSGVIGAMKVSSWGSSNVIQSQGGILESASIADGDQTGEATITTGITMTDADNLVIVATADHVSDPGADAIKCNIEFVTTTTFSIQVYGAGDVAQDGHTVHIMVMRVGA